MNTNSKIKNNFFEFIITLAILTFVRPVYFTSISNSSYLYFGLSTVIVIMLIFLFYRRFLLSYKTLLFSLFFSYWLFSSVINGVLIPSMIMNSVTLIFLFLTIDILSQSNPKMTIKSIYIVYTLFSLINLFLLIIYPEGISIGERGERINFINIDNEIPNFLIPMIYFSLMYYRYFKSRFSILLMIFIVSLTTILAPTTTAIVIYIYIFINVIIFRLLKTKKWALFLQVAIVIFIFWFLAIGQYQSVVSYFIENVLGKDVTLTNRTVIWDTAINLIVNSSPKNFIFGFGNRYILFEITGNSYFSHSHSEYFEYFLKYGLLGFISIISIFIYILVNSIKKTTHHSKSYTFPVILGLLLMGIVETAYSLDFYFMLAYMVYIVHSEMKWCNNLS